MKSTAIKTDHASGVKSHAEKSSSKEAQGLRTLFEEELKDIYWAEQELVKAIPKMIKNSTSPELAQALVSHLEETINHVARLEKVFTSIGVKPQAKKCEATVGLIKEAVQIMEETSKGVVRDAGIISAGQKVEHYEIATYGTLSSFANTLGEAEVVALLDETLNEEKEADKKLSEISDSINVEAAGVEEEEEEEMESKRK